MDLAKDIDKVKRIGRVIGLRPGSKAEYVKYHSAVWHEVLQTIRDCNIRNYSIFLKDNTLFAYFEYVGQDFEADMAKMAADTKTQDWWAIMEPMQVPIPTRSEGEWWAQMERVFHTD